MLSISSLSLSNDFKHRKMNGVFFFNILNSFGFWFFYQHTRSSLWKSCFVSLHNSRLKLRYFFLISSPNLVCKWNMKKSIYYFLCCTILLLQYILALPTPWEAPWGLPNTAYRGIQFLFNSGFASSHVITCTFNYSSLKRWQVKLLKCFPSNAKQPLALGFPVDMFVMHEHLPQ